MRVALCGNEYTARKRILYKQSVGFVLRSVILSIAIVFCSDIITLILIVRSKSMQKKTLTLAISIALTSSLAQAQDNAALETVTVEDTYATTTPITDYEEMSHSTTTDLKDVFIGDPAVQFGGGNGTSQRLTIRGMGEYQVDVVVDNTDSTSEIFHHQNRYTIDPALIKIIDVEKGTGSASAGIGATSGRIVARTVDAADLLEDGKNVGFRINGSASSNEGYGGGFALYGRAGSFDGIFVANWNNEENYEDGNGDEVLYSAVDSRSFLAKGAYNIDDNNRIELSHRYEEQDGIKTLRQEFFMGNAAAGRDDPRYRKITQNTINLAYEGRNLGALGDVDANIFYFDNNMEEGESASPRFTVTGDTYTKTSGANVGFTTPLGSSEHKIKYGVNWRQEKSGGENSTLGEQKKTDSGIYAEGIWDFAPVTLTTGLRYDHFKLTSALGSSTSDSNWNPSIGAIWDVTDSFSLNASYNIASRSPRLQEAYFSSLDFAATSAAYGLSDNIKSQSARNAEIGFNWDYNGLSLEGAVYYQTIKDLTNYGENSNGNYVLYSEGDLKNKGYELNASYRWKGLTARAGVADNDPEMNGTTYDSITTAVPLGRQWTTSLSYRFENPKLTLGWRGNYAEKSDYIDSDGDNVVRHGYGVHDIFLNWQPTGKDDMNVNFSINNVGDKYYQSQSTRATSVALAEPGRNYRLNFNYRF